ncbi:hypothetical protein PEX1_001800 [Penicillium expansum]|uniref:Transcription factor, fungi n=1 Tax=Penicillium expansum TaxID=27334 RepID=A0A0A2JIN7_PENEN|nr:hypothetical protein PEX2_018560 [Penicillium expansum]KGO46783.1 hypothetical protein PEXP_064730 [Penicillium expansum]KGO55272.1 hypothetical protein PEX1_001800 [Penicillium expansum]KGO62449.1 hypothetical protein PEX2_018560 [Penicillium expansum]
MIMSDGNSAKTAHLQRRLDLVEQELRLEIENLRAEVAGASHNSDAGFSQRLLSQRRPTTLSVAETDIPSSNIESSIITTESEWDELYAFFCAKCATVISVIDDQLYSPSETIKNHPLMSAVICAIASRAVRPAKYQEYVATVDKLIMHTFQGPVPDLLGLQAMIVFATWTGRTRLIGYIASVATELKLHEAAILIGDEETEYTPDLVGRARTWFTLCCLDLQTNISRPFVINNMRDYLPYAKYIAMSPHHRPVDDRIRAYIKGFTITGNLKGQLKSSQLTAKPLLQEVVDLFTSADEKVDQWFHEINNNIHPLYQTFPERQDRNRLLMPFAFMKLYINGLALQGVGSVDELTSDPARVEFIQRALDSASLIIQTQYESDEFKRAFQYTMDYFCTPTYYAISFIFKALPLAYNFVDSQRLLARVRQAAHMFQQAGAYDAANELRQGVDRIGALTQTILSPESLDPEIEIPLNALFDIPSFIDEMAWDDDFPTLGMFPSV